MQCIRERGAVIIGIVKKCLLLMLLTTLLFMLPGCANRQDAADSGDIVHGSAGVRIQSQDTSRFAPAHSPY